MTVTIHRVLIALVVAFNALGVQASEPLRKTKVVILGVNHAAQLVAPAASAGMMTAFMEQLRPDAICIERPPEQVARNDYYEFTYEVQDVVLPYLAAHAANLCAVDWMPSLDDQMLAFGVNLDVPPEVRPLSGFQGFLSFPEPEALSADLFFADEPSAAAMPEFALRAATESERDFPRRLFLYRTFLQAKRIAAAARAHAGRTVLVVIGYFHKPDVEAILARDPAIELVKAASFPRPAADVAERAMSHAQRAAVLSFNLLGRQGSTGNLDLPWVRRTLEGLERTRQDSELRLFRLRWNQLTATAPAKQLIAGYRKLIAEVPTTDTFTWTGVKDGTRLDSYFDPFGNITVVQRATVELILLLEATGSAREAASLSTSLKAQLSPRKARQFDAYRSLLQSPARP